MPLDLPSLGLDGPFRGQLEPYIRAGHWPARVSRVDRGCCTVLGEAGAQRASIGGAVLAAAAHDPVRLPCVGDWVVVRTWPDERTTIEAVLARRTSLVRASAGKQATSQILAANVDVVAVVASLDPEPDTGMIERLIAVAWASGARPVVLVAKADLAADPGPIVQGVAECAPGVAVHAVSATTGAGIDQVRALVPPGVTLGLLGASGAGKSTLVNALAGAVVMGTQEIRRSDGRGRHTTTFRALVPLPGGGVVLDTPGIRSVGLTGYAGAGAAGLDRAFADVDDLAGACRFGDCSHTDEPGCAVLAAVAEGDLTARRLGSWRKLHREIAHETHRQHARAVAEQRPHWQRRGARSGRS